MKTFKSEILPSSSWGLGQVTWAKVAKTYFTYDVSHKKTNPKTNTFFFISDSKTCRVFWGFEQLSSAVAWGVMWLV